VSSPERNFQSSQRQNTAGAEINQYHKQTLEICLNAIDSMQGLLEEDQRTFGKHILDLLVKDMKDVDTKLNNMKKVAPDMALQLETLIQAVRQARIDLNVASDMLLKREDYYSEEARRSFYVNLDKFRSSLEEASNQFKEVLKNFSSPDEGSAYAS
jgi:hypothetical protein